MRQRWRGERKNKAVGFLISEGIMAGHAEEESGMPIHQRQRQKRTSFKCKTWL